MNEKCDHKILTPVRAVCIDCGGNPHQIIGQRERRIAELQAKLDNRTEARDQYFVAYTKLREAAQAVEEAEAAIMEGGDFIENYFKLRAAIDNLTALKESE